MKVFISSVTHLLKDERNALPPFLRILDHVPLRFEDFQSQDRSGREACVAGVEASDVYVLLLGPRYGDPLADTGLAPTAEEFRVARNLGRPVLVFVKTTDEPDEPEQAAFKVEVGHYVNGRLWKPFTDPMSLTIAVGEALKDLPVVGGPFRPRPLTDPVPAPWSTTDGLRPSTVDALVLELHLIPLGDAQRIGATGLAAAAEHLARDARATGFVPQSDPLDHGSDNHRAWAVRPAERTYRRDRSVMGATDEAWRGLAISNDGTASAYVSLSTDFAGALVDQRSLQTQIAAMITLLAPHLQGTGDITVAARLAPAEQIREGDPSEVGKRNEGTVSSRAGTEIVMEPAFAVTRRDLTDSTGDIAAEVAISVINDVRQIAK